MAIQRWDPVREIMQLKERLSRVLEETVSHAVAHGAQVEDGHGWTPAIDLYEEPGRYVLRADVPGVAPGDFELTVEGETLILRGERKIDPAVPAEAYLRVERPHGRFSAQLALPPSVERNAIRAVHHSGVIEIILPKEQKQQGPGRIEVKSE